MPGYKHPCRYCSTLVEDDAGFCPRCGRVNPTGPLRCQRCEHPVAYGDAACSSCGLALSVTCPSCKQPTFLGDYCYNCWTRLSQKCSHCGSEQPLFAQTCSECNKPLPPRKG